jgi:Flp pilus assembly protein TadG
MMPRRAVRRRPLPRRPVRRRPTGDAGSAVVEFVLVSVLLVLLLLAVAQVAVYLHVRAVTTASAAEGARYAANADVTAEAGAARAEDVLGRGVGAGTANRLRCAASDTGGGGLVAVRCAGTLPVFFAPLGGVLPVDVTGHALEEGP